MKKALIVKEEFMGREVGTIEQVGTVQEIDSVNNRFISKMEKVDVPSFLTMFPIKSVPPTADLIEEFWFKDGEITSVDPEDETWVHHPALDAFKWEVTLDIEKYKADEISKSFRQLETEIYAEMRNVFGANTSDSASADEATYRLWSEDPAFYAGQSFLAKVDTPSYTKGDVLDLETDILTYANEMLAKIKDYALWRKQKERDFSIKKASIENS
jgi:hypothetical protein